MNHAPAFPAMPRGRQLLTFIRNTCLATRPLFPHPHRTTITTTTTTTSSSSSSSRRHFCNSSASRQNTASSSRPPTAPKQYPNVKEIRQYPDVYAQNCVDRNYHSQAAYPAKIAALAQEAAELSRRLLAPRKRVKELERQIAKLQQKQQSSSDQSGLGEFLQEAQVLRNDVQALESRLAECNQVASETALALPNLTSPLSPVGDDPGLIEYHNYDPAQPPSFANSKDHSTIGLDLSLLDFSSASTTTGWGFYYLLNEAALLEQALIQYAMSVAMRHGWRVVSPPSLVYSHIADACGFQPRDQNDEQQIWQVAQPERDVGKPRRSLAATAEIPLAAMYAGKDIPEAELPVKLVGSSRCYRAEAGARGVDTKGLYRVHEFSKLEMFAWTDSVDSALPQPQFPEGLKYSDPVFQEMVNIQIEILSSLQLPFRVLEMPCSDLGASAYRKIDMEVLFPSRLSRDGGWGEVTSVSMCTDYQSRRLGARVLEKGGARKKFPHTLNGTAMAVPRVLAAVLEHGWRAEENCVMVPEVLWPYMHGIEVIRSKA